MFKAINANTMLDTLKLLIATSTLLLVSACGQKHSALLTLNGNTMGTNYSIKFVSITDKQELDTTDLHKRIDSRLLQINQLMSTYIPDSELSLLNQAPANTPFALTSETAVVIQEAITLGMMSEGALDVTVGPLVNLWGFGPDKRPDVAPTQAEIDKMREVVGLDKFRLQENAIYKQHDDVYIDLSTLAKGYAVDELALVLEDAGIQNYLVEIGGEMRISGKKPGNEDWRLAIEKPITTERAVQRIIVIGDNAIATSGDYRNYFEQDGVRFSHLIDPQTAAPIQHNLVAVSVIAPSSMRADGLATALIIMGAERGKELAERENIAALFITKESDEFVEYHSTAFTQQVRIIQ